MQSRKRLEILSGVVLGVFFTAIVHACAQEYHQEVSLDIGAAEPLSSIGLASIGGGSVNDGALGIQGGGQYLYYLRSPRIGVGLDIDYIDRNSEDSTTLIPNGDASVYGDTLLLLATLKYTLDDDSAALPYITLGLGAALNSTVLNAHPASYSTGWSNTGTYETRQFVNDDQWVPAASLKLGAEYHIFGPQFLGIEVGWTGLASASYAATAAAQDAGIACPSSGFPSTLHCSAPNGHEASIANVSGPLNFLSAGVRWKYKF